MRRLPGTSAPRTARDAVQLVVCEAIFWLPLTMPGHYYNRRQRTYSRRHATLERVVTAVVLALVIAVLLVFLLVYHDFPLRVSGP